jgi:hypothetical protein
MLVRCQLCFIFDREWIASQKERIREVEQELSRTLRFINVGRGEAGALH